MRFVSTEPEGKGPTKKKQRGMTKLEELKTKKRGGGPIRKVMKIKRQREIKKNRHKKTSLIM